MFKHKPHHKVLGIDPDAAAEEIRKAYCDLALRFHPEGNPNNRVARRLFLQATAAYRALRNRQKTS